MSLLDELNMGANLLAGFFGLDKNKRANDLQRYNKALNDINAYESRRLDKLTTDYNNAQSKLQDKKSDLSSKYNELSNQLYESSLTVDNTIDRRNENLSKLYDDYKARTNQIDLDLQSNSELYKTKQSQIQSNANVLRNKEEDKYGEASKRLFD